MSRSRVWCVVVLLVFAVIWAPCGHAAEEGDPRDGKVAESGAQEKKEEAKVTGSGSIGLFNKYIFRGYELSKGSLVVQPALSASYKGFTVTYWGNIDTDARDTQSYFPSSYGKEGKKWFNETDLTVSYTYTFNKLALTFGYIYYNTKYAEETEELFLGAALDVITKPSLTIYQDITSYPGTYVNLAFAHSFDLMKEKGITLDLGASAGYFHGSGKYWKTYQPATGGYTGKKYSGLHDGMVKAGLTIPVTKAFMVQPVVQYWFPLSGDAKKKYGPVSYNPNGYLADNVVYGATFTYSF